MIIQFLTRHVDRDLRRSKFPVPNKGYLGPKRSVSKTKRSGSDAKINNRIQFPQKIPIFLNISKFFSSQNAEHTFMRNFNIIDICTSYIQTSVLCISIHLYVLDYSIFANHGMQNKQHQQHLALQTQYVERKYKPDTGPGRVR